MRALCTGTYTHELEHHYPQQINTCICLLSSSERNLLQIAKRNEAKQEEIRRDEENRRTKLH